ncbi:MAG: transglycosylase SLT domain-containing protein [Mycoplasmatales bacterium]
MKKSDKIKDLFNTCISKIIKILKKTYSSHKYINIFRMFLVRKYFAVIKDLRKAHGIRSLRDFMIVHKFTSIFVMTVFLLIITITVDSSLQYQVLKAEGEKMGIVYNNNIFVKPNTIFAIEQINSMTEKELEKIINEKKQISAQLGVVLDSVLEGMDLKDQPSYIDQKIKEREEFLVAEAQRLYEEQLALEAAAEALRLEEERIALEKQEEAERAAIIKQYSKISGSIDDWLNSVGISENEAAFAKFIIQKESGLNPLAGNTSGAYGLCQAAPGNKMASAGEDWESNPYTQMKWCNNYVMNRYGSWESAYIYWMSNSSF